MFCLVCDDFLVRNPKKRTWKRIHHDTPGKINSHEKRYLGGECLVLRGTPFQSEMVDVSTTPPQKIMAEMPEMMLDPRFTALISISRRCFGRAKLLTPLWLIALKTQQSKGWNISPLLHCCGGRKAPDLPIFLCCFSPVFFSLLPRM